jgi:uncharacterized protein (UPF0147 family)
MIAIVILIVGLIIGYLVYCNLNLRKENQKLESENQEYHYRYLSLLEQYMNKTSSVPSDAKRQLSELQKKFTNINEDVSVELTAVMELLNESKESIAIEKLTKIIENVLSDRLMKESGNMESKKMTFMESIKEAVKSNIVCKRLGAFIDALRVIRNEEAHELNVQLSNNETLLYVLAGIHILCELSQITI